MVDLPHADLELVIDPRVYGNNLKVSNLINMTPRARHDVLVIADSDMRVRPDYLDAVVAPLQRHGVGLVTCLYVGRPTGGIWAQLGAMWINYTFLPSALVDGLMGAGQGCFGATLALRRETLRQLGGFAALRDQLADDYALGAAIRGLGLQLAQSRYIVGAVIDEPDFASLFRHQLRWGRTIRSIAPVGFALSIVTYPLVTAALALLVGGVTGPAVLCVAVAIAGRATLVRMAVTRLRIDNPGASLVPVSDLISFAVVVASFCGRDVEWRGQRFRIAAGGKLIALREPGK
jgi:ceramide glucosyltransferase